MDNHEKPHVYDGIVEQNNPMPRWWTILFCLCVGFSFLYWIHYEIGGGPSLAAEYKTALDTYNAEVAKNAPAGGSDTEDSLMAVMNGEDAIHAGRSLFKEKCAMCHGENLEGKIGPNLTDNFWTTGDGSRMAIVHTIQKGSPAKGMPAWETMLKPEEIKAVAAYVYSKIGSQPANPKAAEGTEVKR